MRTILLVVVLGVLAGCPSFDSRSSPAGADAQTDSKSADAAIDARPDAAPLLGIAGVRTAADGTATSVSIPVTDVYVTYLKPATGTEPAGFFVQKQAAGPAVFIAVDPATLSAAVGDIVSFTVTDVDKTGGLREATAITGYSRTATGFDVSTLVTDVSSATDVVSSIDAYESRLVRMTATIASGFASAGGGGFVSAQVDTAGVTGNTSLKMRLPTTLQTSMDLVNTCALTLTGPMWRFNTQAQPSGFVPSDLSVSSCPAPHVMSAAPSNLTTIVVTFDRTLAASSVMSDGSQFTFDNGLSATAASVIGKTVTLTTTTQTVDAAYTLSVANTVTDTYGTAVDSASDTASFTGYVQVASLVINEVNPNIGSSKDLIELRVTSPGTVKDMTVGQALGTPVTVATLPNITVAAGDLIVIHTGTTDTTTETTGKTQCTDAVCYAGAWDVAGTTAGLTFSHRVLWVKNADSSLHDAVPFVLSTTTTPPGAFPTDLQSAQASGFWLPADCGGAPCTYTSTPTAVEVSFDWATVGTTAAGKSAARIGTGKTSADWTILSTSTFGAPNP
jgi:hypothetical protein